MSTSARNFPIIYNNTGVIESINAWNEKRFIANIKNRQTAWTNEISRSKMRVEAPIELINFLQ